MIKIEHGFTDEELLDISDRTALQVIRGYLANKTVVPDFTKMSARYQLIVLNGVITTALEMKPDDVPQHCPEAFKSPEAA